MSDCMDVFVARQAILDRRKTVFAYELLFRSGQANAYDGTDSSSATAQVISNTLFSSGLEDLLGNKKAFVNFDRNMLLSGACAMLPKETLVIEVLETVEPDEEVVAACRKLRADGYTIALDDFIHSAKFEPLLEIAQIIKVDLLVTSRDEQQRLIAKYGKRGVQMLAEKVEALTDFESALGMGFDFFQGYFFTKPVIVRGRQIPTSKMSCLRLLNEVQREDIDFDKLCKLIEEDVSFSYKLLRFVNSAYFARQTEIRSVYQALIALGEEGIRRWVAVAALPGLAKDKPQELIVQSLVRAHFSEQIARLAGFSEAKNGFMLGLFSLLDALLDRPLEEALGQIKLAPPVEEALLRTSPEDRRLGSAYALIRSYEFGDWDSVTSLADQIGILSTDVGNAYVSSAKWVAQMTGLT
jgi:EAL and modified HD-GYP domain-containing signal transduction protein